MADATNIGLVATVVGTILGFLAFWDRLTGRIAKANEKAKLAGEKAESAMQDAAEAKNDLANIHDALDEMTRDMHDRMERMSRETGESNAAIRQHVTELSFFLRDNFVRNDVFLTSMSKIDAGQLRTETKLDALREQIRNGG